MHGLVWILLLSILAFTSSAYAADGDFLWALGMGGPSSDLGRAIAIDGKDNVYMTGSFVGLTDYDPGPDISELSSAGDEDVFVTKSDSNGNLIWARGFGGTHADSSNGIAVDFEGNVYTTGYFTGTSDFDPGPGITLLRANNYGIFISKLDSEGDFLWARCIDGPENEFALSIAVDNFGSVFTTGTFSGATLSDTSNRHVDFDPGPGISLLASGGGFSPSAFVLKLDSDGNFAWARGLGGSAHGMSVALDGAGNVLTAGYFQGRADFDPGVGEFKLAALGLADAYISNLDPDGNFVWATRLGHDGNDQGNAIAVDTAGSIYVTGRFEGTVAIDRGLDKINLTSSGRTDIFVAKLDRDGKFLWANSLGGASWDEGWSIAANCDGDAYITGNYSSPLVVQTSSGPVNLSPTERPGAVVLKLNSAGNVDWAWGVGNTSPVHGAAVALDSRGNNYSIGYFYQRADFYPEPSDRRLTSAGSQDVYLFKLSGPEEDEEEGSGEGSPNSSIHDADQDRDGRISLSELLRIIQLYTSSGYHCKEGTEDGYAPGLGGTCCPPQDSDFAPQYFVIDIHEVLRVIQLYDSEGYHECSGTEDGFCPFPV